MSDRRGRLMSAESLAGWVFADLLLILFLVGLGSAVAFDPPEPAEVAPPKARADSKPKPKPEPKIVGMQTEPTPVIVNFDPSRISGSDQQLCRTVRLQTRKLDGQKAALVLVFGGGSDVATGQTMARGVARQLTCADDDLFARGTPARPFWDGGLQLGSARLEIFLYTTTQTK